MSEEESGSHLYHSWSRINYTAAVSDTGSSIQCIATQYYDGVILYSTSHTITLSITQPSPLIATQVSSIGTWAGAGLAIILAIIILIIIAIKLVMNNKHTSVDDTNSEEMPKIWTTNTASHDSSVLGSKQSLSNYPSSMYKTETNPICRVDIHNSSSSCSSSKTPVSTDTSFETNRSVPEILERDVTPCSPVYMYSKASPPHPEDNPYKSYQPHRLGHFDPARDVHSVTRPNTGDSSDSPSIYPVPYNITVRPFHTLKIHPQEWEERETRLQSWEDASIGGTSTISVFDCHHGCFSPHHQHGDDHQDREAGLVPSDQILVSTTTDHPSFHKAQSITQSQDNLYMQESHCSPTGQRFTVKTRDIQL